MYLHACMFFKLRKTVGFCLIVNKKLELHVKFCISTYDTARAHDAIGGWNTSGVTGRQFDSENNRGKSLGGKCGFWPSRKRENVDLRKSNKEPNKSCSMLATQNKPSPQHIQKYKQ